MIESEVFLEKLIFVDNSYILIVLFNFITVYCYNIKKIYNI